jgi:hypothetical protein
MAEVALFMSQILTVFLPAAGHAACYPFLKLVKLFVFNSIWIMVSFSQIFIYQEQTVPAAVMKIKLGIAILSIRSAYEP